MGPNTQYGFDLFTVYRKAPRNTNTTAAVLLPATRSAMTDSSPPLHDWREPWLKDRTGLVVGVLAFGEDLLSDRAADYDAFAHDAQQITGSVAAFAAYVDPGVGASGQGVGLLLEFMDVAADVVALGTAALAVAPKLKRLVASFRSRPDIVEICLLPDALQVLVVAEVCRRHGVRPADLQEVSRRDVYPDALPERRVELQQMDTCSIVTVVVRSDLYQSVWTYVVTSQGRVITDARVDVPYPGLSYWTEAAQASRPLDGLSP